MKWVENFLTKNNDTSTRPKELYNRIIEHSNKDSHDDSVLSNLLEYCAILYQPENYSYYAEFDEKGNVFEQKEVNIPDWLPQNYKELVENCTSLFYRVMNRCISRQEEYLKYPEFKEMEKHIDQLCLEECMQFFLFYNRLSLRHGQQYFFEKWKDGTTLCIVKRMQQLRKNS